MNIVIIGAGKIGATLTEQLLREGHEITVVDTRTAALDAIGNTLDVMTVEGNGISMDTQVEAGVPSADLVIAVMSTDEQNLLSCLIAKRLGVGNTIARVRNPEYTSGLHLIQDDLGLSMALNPELASATEIARILRAPASIKIDTFSKGRVELHKMRIDPEAFRNPDQVVRHGFAVDVKLHPVSHVEHAVHFAPRRLRFPLDNPEQQRRFEQIVLDHVQLVDKMQNFGLSAATAMDHAADIAAVLLQHCPNNRSVRPRRRQHQFANRQRTSLYGIGQTVFTGINQIFGNLRIERFRILLADDLRKNVVPGRSQSVAAHPSVVFVLVGRLSRRTESDDITAAADIRIVDHVTAPGTRRYGFVF